MLALADIVIDLSDVKVPNIPTVYSTDVHAPPSYSALALTTNLIIRLAYHKEWRVSLVDRHHIWVCAVGPSVEWPF